ncbi:lactate dehydrogenase [Vibrio barjaei]|uniref:lactate dehydrogenase n=1 Tax=Vibrio barjaei TaxID=1676683 RepID=UPI0022844FC9|nr:lactate dehydrogenase [Vibrio barjaei]MCY9872614.1 lactate dehydrogenase [Vibrio barjaei]
MSEGRLPLAANGLQLNFCKTLACDNFGRSDANLYILQHSNPKRPAMVCRECGAFPPLLNNREVLNELDRLSQHHHDGLPSCKDAQCENYGLSVHTHKDRYHAFGFSGDRQRYRCKSCQGTFVDRWSGTNKKLTFQETLLGLLFTGYSVREICRKLEVNPKTFYDHIDQIASRCRRKLADIDARWINHADEYQLTSNYRTLQPVSNNGVFWFATCDANSGYVLCQHTNYSADATPTGFTDHNAFQVDCQIVPSDYSAENNSEVNIPTDNLKSRIDVKYQNILARSNVEDPLGNFAAFNYPAVGALIRAPYTSYAHYLHILKSLTDNKRVSIYMPQDPVLRSAALTICLPRIQAGTVDLMYVEQDENWADSEPSEMIDVVLMGWWRDRWAVTQQPSGASKGICYLAGSNPNVPYWLKTASTKQIDFYQDRFQLLFESFINEPRRKLRPAGIHPLLDIFRAWHNLCYQDRCGQTAAQRLGVTDSPMTLKCLLS